MDFQDCIKFANDNATCIVATAERSQPRARYLRMCYADETGFYFQIASVKAIYKQLQDNDKVELCFVARDIFTDPESHSAPGVKQLRVYGKAKIVDDMATRSKIFHERPFLKEMGIETPDNSLLVVFQIYTGEAYFWKTEDSMKEGSIPRIKF